MSLLSVENGQTAETILFRFLPNVERHFRKASKRDWETQLKDTTVPTPASKCGSERGNLNADALSGGMLEFSNDIARPN